jgi:hypothetical protein
MRKLLLVGLLGCWSSSPKPASEPKLAETQGSTGGATYGGEQYGILAVLKTSDDVFADPHGSGNVMGGGAIGTGGVAGGVGGTGQPGPPPPSVTIGDPGQTGALDKAIIRRYIKRNQQKIQYCYEKELLAKPNLSGTVMTNFLITPNGNVSTANGSGVDPNVANCVADVIRNIEFPKPKGGGNVQVNYPFIFRLGGGG